MKQIAAVLILATLVACAPATSGSGSNGGGSVTLVPLTAVTDETLVGSWEKVQTETWVDDEEVTWTDTTTTTYQFTGEGDYFMSSIEVSVPDNEAESNTYPEYEKGDWSIDGGILTLHTTGSRESESDDWYDQDTAITGDAVIGNDTLYLTGVTRAMGTTSGLTGTWRWLRHAIETYNGETTYDWTKRDTTFTSSGFLSVTTYESEAADGTFPSEPSSSLSNVPFSISGKTILLGGTPWQTFVAGTDYLVFMSPGVRGLTKIPE